MMLRAARPLVHRCRSTRSITHFPIFVQNELREAVDGATIDIEDPATGASIATCATAGPKDVAAAVDAAKAAWPAWRDLGAKKRATILRNAAQELRRRVPELCEIETRQTGRPLREYKAQFGRVPEWFEYHASLAETTEGAVPNFIGDPDHLCVVQKVPNPNVVAIAPSPLWTSPGARHGYRGPCGTGAAADARPPSPDQRRHRRSARPRERLKTNLGVVRPPPLPPRDGPHGIRHDVADRAHRRREAGGQRVKKDRI